MAIFSISSIINNNLVQNIECLTKICIVNLNI